MNYALDAGAMIAYLDDEPGAANVEAYLTEPGSVCFAHYLNLAEIYYIYYRRGGQTMADDALHSLRNDAIEFRADNDEAFWTAAASYKGRHALALPDGFCLAMAVRLGGTVVSTDHAEFDPLVPLGYCPIEFVR